MRRLTVSHEAKAAAAYIRKRKDETDALVKRARLTAHEGDMLNRRLETPWPTTSSRDCTCDE
jgi:hypothetical protein